MNGLVLAEKVQLFVSEKAEDKLFKEQLTFKPHSLTTEDGYLLTLLRLSSLDETLPTADAGSILLQHDSSMDGLSWFETNNESLPSLLIKAGYDVWLGNDRGTKNSQRNDTPLHPIEDAKEFWDFSWVEMGLYDAPANLNYIKNYIGVDALTYIGYGQGATSILYGMSNKYKQLYFKQLLTEVIVMAPCIFLNQPITTIQSTGLELNMADQLYMSYERNFDMYDQVGVYAYNGPDSEADINKLCYLFGQNNPECRRAKKPAGYGQPFSVKSQKHFQQNQIEGRF